MCATRQIRQDLLRKYIAYARANVHPRIQNIDTDRIASLYAELRRESLHSGGLPIAPRHVESIIRLSEAHAKLHLRQDVTEDDVNVAIRVMLESFIGAQKYAVKAALRKKFEKYLTYKEDSNELLLHALQQIVRDTVQWRQLSAARALSEAEANAKAAEIMARTSGRSGTGAAAAAAAVPVPAAEEVIAPNAPVRIPLDEFQQKAARLQVTDVTPFFRSSLFTQAGFTFNAHSKEIVHSYE